MTQRDMARQGLLVLCLIVGIVGGNFVLHRWMLGNTTSREADAGIATTNPLDDDLAEYAPARRSTVMPLDSATHRERLRKIMAEKLPNISAEEQDAWVEELSDVALPMAEGILDLRGQVGALPVINGSTDLKAADAEPSDLELSPVVPR